MFSQVFVCPRGVSVERGEGSLHKGVSVRETTLHSNERAVRILLECILGFLNESSKSLQNWVATVTDQI